MVSVLALVKKRRTIYEFENKNINKSNLKKILEAGRWAPSPHNKQPWKFVVVKDKNKISELMKIAPYGGFHSNPNLIIVFGLNPKICSGNHVNLKKGKIGLVDGYLSLGVAAENMILIAESLGIGSAVLTPEPKKISKILKTKEISPMFLGFGYEKKGSFRKERVRKKLKELVKYE